MAVPGRRNGFNDDEDDDNLEEDNALFEQDNGLLELDFSDTPPHLRDLAAASQSGHLPNLRLALGSLSLLFFSL